MTKPRILKNVPCRGCVADCIYYPECEGRLWRLNDIQEKKQEKIDTNDDLESVIKSE